MRREKQCASSGTQEQSGKAGKGGCGDGGVRRVEGEIVERQRAADICTRRSTARAARDFVVPPAPDEMVVVGAYACGRERIDGQRNGQNDRHDRAA